MRMQDLAESLSALLGTRYQIRRELGRGGMATVFLARDVRHERDVALKVLRPDLGIVFQDPTTSLDPRQRVRDVLDEATIRRHSAEHRPKKDARFEDSPFAPIGYGPVPKPNRVQDALP